MNMFVNKEHFFIIIFIFLGGGALFSQGTEILTVSTISLECSLFFHYLKMKENIQISKFHRIVKKISLLFLTTLI